MAIVNNPLNVNDVGEEEHMDAVDLEDPDNADSEEDCVSEADEMEAQNNADNQDEGLPEEPLVPDIALEDLNNAEAGVFMAQLQAFALNAPGVRTATCTCDLFSIIKLKPFQDFVRSLTRQHGPHFRFQNSAMLALHQAAECYISDIMKESAIICENAKRDMLTTKDMKIGVRMVNKQ